MIKPVVDPKRTNLEAIPAHFLAIDGVWPEFIQPGRYEIKGSLFMMSCPGCGSVSGMTIGTPKPKQSPSWLITKTGEGKPTLSPSINCVGCCGWHGRLTNGVFYSM